MIFKVVEGIAFCDAGFQNSFDKPITTEMRCVTTGSPRSSETLVFADRNRCVVIGCPMPRTDRTR